MKFKNIYKRKSVLIPLFLLVMFICVALIKAPIKQTFEYDGDEGMDLISSLLVMNGFSLYKDIWYDQPPLMPVILSYWFKLFGPSVYHARILILIFSCLFLWAFYQTIKNQWGDFCAFTAVIFLFSSALFLPLHVSVMICTPARALAMLSIYCITLYKKLTVKYLLILSGIFMALSLHAKLIFLFLVPLILLEIAQAKWKKDKSKLKHSLPALLLWLGIFLTVYIIIIIIFFNFDFSLLTQQLIQPHLKRINLPAVNFSVIWRKILTDYDIALLALMGIILVYRQKYLFPVLWLILALFILAIHRPVWDHYYLLVSIPISWLGAISFSEFFINIRHKRQRKDKTKKKDILLRWLTVCLITLTILRLPGKLLRTYSSIWAPTSLEEHKIIEVLSKYGKHTRWIFTNRPIFAFYANILVPPELAIITLKRDDFNEKTVAEGYLIDKLKKYRPELILLELEGISNYTYYGMRVMSYFKKNYSEVHRAKVDNEINLPPYIYWNPKYIIFLGRIWHYKLPHIILNGNREKSIRTETMLYIRKDVKETLQLQ